jgi:hypothetical protein
VGISNFQGQGANYVPAYQTSGTPYAITLTGVTTTSVKVTFPYVTRWVVVSATDATTAADVRIGFSENGTEVSPDRNYYLLPLTKSGDEAIWQGQTPRLELRCKELWIRGDSNTIGTVSIIAGMTGISKDQFPILSGSQGFEGVG